VVWRTTCRSEPATSIFAIVLFIRLWFVFNRLHCQLNANHKHHFRKVHQNACHASMDCACDWWRYRIGGWRASRLHGNLCYETASLFHLSLYSSMLTACCLPPPVPSQSRALMDDSTQVITTAQKPALLSRTENCIPISNRVIPNPAEASEGVLCHL